MSNELQSMSIFRNVCDATGGDGFHIEHMPHLFDIEETFVDGTKVDNAIPHVHTFYEILWFWEDGGIHTVDFTEYPIKANTFFFLAPGQVHHFDGVTRHKGVTLKFCTDFMTAEEEQKGTAAGSGQVFMKYNIFNNFDSAPCCVVTDKGAIEKLRHIVALLEQEETLSQHDGCCLNEDFAHMDMLRALMRILLIYIYRYGKRQGVAPLETAKPSHRLFIKFREAVEEHYESLHTVTDYAALLHVSTKTLSNAVQECSGKTPLTFINDRIMLEAKRLLRFTNLMVKEIAYRLGYDDPSYFVKFFKRQTGTLPVQFKEGT